MSFNSVNSILVHPTVDLAGVAAKAGTSTVRKAGKIGHNAAPRRMNHRSGLQREAFVPSQTKMGAMQQITNDNLIRCDQLLLQQTVASRI